MEDKRNRRMHPLDRLDGGRYILRDELLHASAFKCFDQREEGTPISIADYETYASCVEIQEVAQQFEAHSLESRELQEIRCLGKYYSPKIASIVINQSNIMRWRYWLTCLNHIQSKLIPESEFSPEQETSLFALISPPEQKTEIGISSDHVQEFR